MKPTLTFFLINVFVYGVINCGTINVACFQSKSFSPVMGRRQTDEPDHIFQMNMVDDNDNRKKDTFWQQQRDLMKEMTESNEQSLKVEQGRQFDTVQNGLIVETGFFAALVFALLWLACDNPFVPLSYVFGATFGVAYTYGLGKYVSTIGGTIDDESVLQGAGVGQARFAFLILLLIFVGKLRVYGLIEIPSIMGFFTYQLATLSQGLKEDKIN